MFNHLVKSSLVISIYLLTNSVQVKGDRERKKTLGLAG